MVKHVYASSKIILEPQEWIALLNLKLVVCGFL